jgi:hypothetical protein
MNWLIMSRSSLVMGHPLWVCQNNPNTPDVAPIRARFNSAPNTPHRPDSSRRSAHCVPATDPTAKLLQDEIQWAAKI